MLLWRQQQHRRAPLKNKPHYGTKHEAESQSIVWLVFKWRSVSLETRNLCNITKRRNFDRLLEYNLSPLKYMQV